MPIPGVSTFGGGVVLVEHPDAGRTDELREAKGFDLGARGALVLSGRESDYVNVQTTTPANFTRTWGIAAGVLSGASPGSLLVVGSEQTGGTGQKPCAAEVAAEGATSPVGAAYLWDEFAVTGKLCQATGMLMTAVSVPYYGSQVTNPLLVCLASREAMNVAPRNGFGLAALATLGGVGPLLYGLNNIDGLGTGAYSEEGVAGTKGKHLYFRWIVAYNNHVFGAGFDNRDATYGWGRNRLMFSNLGRPLKWGNDDQGTGNRDYSDTDALEIGGAGESLRAGYAWNGRLWLATNRSLHWVQGYGRQTFQTDGVTSAVRLNATGPYAMIEGPDDALYLLTTHGLVRYDGNSADDLWRKLRAPGGRSPGWWDLIWYDGSAGAVFTYYPGTTNQDLCWLASDRDARQVWVVIPFCNASTGYGRGDDTVVLKYHVDTGGWTRQVFTGQCYTAGCILPRERDANATTLLGQSEPTVGALAITGTTVQRYAHRASLAAEPTPTTSAQAILGDYAFAGPAGAQVTRRVYLTLGWPSASALPLALDCVFAVDEQPVDTVRLTIDDSAPVGPNTGDLWLDTSGADAVLGVGVAGSLVGAAADYVLKTWRNGAWYHVPGAGQIGTRVTVPVPFAPRRGARLRVTVTLVAASARFWLEGVALKPTTLTEAA